MTGRASWTAADGRAWCCRVDLPDLPGGTIIVPSLSVLDRPGYRFQFELVVADRRYPLPVVPSTSKSGDPSDERVRTAIDCFQTGEPLTQQAEVPFTMTVRAG